MKLKYFSLLLCGALTLTSCNDFLDREPEDSLTPSKYFTAEADLAAYSLKYYNFNSIQPGSYGIGTFADDNGTDNQVNAGGSNLWIPGQYKVGSSNPWDFSQVRHCNYFFEKVLPKYEAGKIQGNADNIKHYIGEMYLLRAYAYFNLLKNIGDCPIITTALPDEESVLLKASHRDPRNKVARFILEDLDKAISLLKEVSPEGKKERVSRDVAYLLRSRVALYEGTFEKYHAGTAFVPGGKDWPGAAEDAAGYDNAAEVKYFLGEAMKSAKMVGDKMVSKLAENTATDEGMDNKYKSINSYYTMFCDVDMSTYPEVLMWREYSVAKGTGHNTQQYFQKNGCNTGWTRGLVNSFVMENGYPIYAAASGYNDSQELNGISATLANRDSRIRIFTKGDNSVESYFADGTTANVQLGSSIFEETEKRAVTGYMIKKGKHYDPTMYLTHFHSVNGSLLFRGVEALLNYIEASYELNGTIDATAESYWKAIRRRAKVNENYSITIAATDMNEEAKGDFAAYSHGKLIDATLYNIRRERRNELIGEGFRWADLQRWRACDQVKNYQVEGFRYWGTVYEGAFRDKDGNDKAVVDLTGEKGNMSAKTLSNYIRPYQIKPADHNLLYNGLNFTPAHYLMPLPQSVFRKTATNKADLKTSVVYQNPGWPMIDGNGAETIE